MAQSKALVKPLAELDRFNLAKEIDQRIENRTKSFLFQTLMDLKEINDKQLFKDLGHKSINDYICVRLGYDKGNASRCLSVIDELLPYALTEGKKVVHVQLSETLPNDQHKLYALTKLTQKQRKQLFEKGNVMLRGHQYSMEDFKTLPRKEVMDIISDARTSKLPKEEKFLIWDDKARNRVADAFDRFESILEEYLEVMPKSCFNEFKPITKPLDTWYQNHLRKS